MRCCLARSLSPWPGASSSVPPGRTLLSLHQSYPCAVQSASLLAAPYSPCINHSPVQCSQRLSWPHLMVPASIIPLCNAVRVIPFLSCVPGAGSRPLRRYGSTVAGVGTGAPGRSPLKLSGSMLRSQEGSLSPLSRQASHAGRQSSPSSRRGTADSLSGATAQPGHT